MFDAEIFMRTITVLCDKCHQSAPMPLAELVSSDSVACYFCHGLIDLTRPSWREAIRNALENT